MPTVKMSLRNISVGKDLRTAVTAQKRGCREREPARYRARKGRIVVRGWRLVVRGWWSRDSTANHQPRTTNPVSPR